MNFKKPGVDYIPNSELGRLTSQMADVIFDKYNNMISEESTTHSAVQYLVKYLEDTEDTDD